MSLYYVLLMWIYHISMLFFFFFDKMIENFY